MDSRSVTTYNPSYIIDQFPDSFGSNQDDYLAKSQEIIDKTAERISAARSNGEDLQKLFFEIIADLSAHRAQIAKDHGTDKAENFGKRREQLPGNISILSMQGKYAAYNTKILNYFAKYLMQMALPNGQFEKERTFTSKCNNKKSTLTIKVMTNEDMSNQGYFTNANEYYPSYIKHEEMELLRTGKKVLDEDYVKEYGDKFRKFKTEQPENYFKWRECTTNAQCLKRFPSPAFYGLTPQQVMQQFPKEEADFIIDNMKTLHVRIVLRTEIDGKLYRMTDYFTWMYETQQWLTNKDPRHHPVERMKKMSKVIMLHQDMLLIEDTLKGVAKIFEANVKWDKNTQTLEELKESMAQMLYLLTHDVRDVRGTSSEDEKLEYSLYKSLGLVCEQNLKEKTVDLEAFAKPMFADFKKEYVSMTDLRFIC